jgi:D-alanyl-D-alanine carboxypeptidase/D-alanyl-D-alanine-endopeptidase (penicillin-binding protein 4)
MRARFAGLLLLCSMHAWAALPEVLAVPLAQAQVPLDSVTVFAQRVDANVPLVDHQSSIPFTPASTMKLVTSYAGLGILGIDYRWRTELQADGEIRDGVLHGNLVLKGYGDPSMMAEQYWSLLRHLRQMGVQDIRGNLIVDNTWFNPAKDNPGAFDGEPYRPYNALASATLVNLKSNSFRLMPDINQPGQVKIAIDPEMPGINIKSLPQLVDGECGDWRNKIGFKITPVSITDQLNTFDIEFNGMYPAACGERSLELSLLDDAAYDFYLFKAIWQQLGGTISGTLQRTAEPMHANTLLVQNSAPLAEVIRPLNKFSNNVMTRQLLLTLAAEKGEAHANEVSGVAVIQSWLAARGLRFPELQIENGAGLSRNARISAASMAALLRDAYFSPVMPELMASLPVVAVDGTLARRLQASPVAGRAHLKTGSLAGVSALAGYVLDKRGRYWVVVFMANHPAAAQTRDVQDTFIQWIYSQD